MFNTPFLPITVPTREVALASSCTSIYIQIAYSITYRTLSNQQPTYLVNLLHFSDIPRTVMSSVTKQLVVPKTKLNIVKRAFSVAAPTIYNQLPIIIFWNYSHIS